MVVSRRDPASYLGSHTEPPPPFPMRTDTMGIFLRVARPAPRSSLARVLLESGTLALVLALATCVAAQQEVATSDRETPPCPLVYINTAFENASPLFWEIDDAGEVNVFLMCDHERSSPNRAAGHWHFRVEAPKGSLVTIVLNNLSNIYGGRRTAPASEETISYVSPDGSHWRAVETELLDGDRLKLRLRMEADQMYVARLEPYRLSDLKRLLDEIRSNPLVAITTIGKTVDGRNLEMIRVGSDVAPHRILIRARAHAWEPGGNWVVQGMIRRLLKGDAKARAYLDRYSVYVMPMANKDAVCRGWTRFNVEGKDLNRNWDKPADPLHAPENRALETWIESMIAQGRKPDLMIDFHNDQGGHLIISGPSVGSEHYLARMNRFETLLREQTWFTEGAAHRTYDTPATVAEGLLQRYGIDACVHELNANWIAGLNTYPSGKNWELYGEQLCGVFYMLFNDD